MPRNLPPRIQSHIARARRMRIIGGALLVTCLLVGTGAALSQTELPHQLATTLKPIASELGNSLSQLPSALTERIPNVDLQLPTTQLAASATSFPQSVAEKVRNLFCRWLGCAAPDLADSSRIPNENLTNIGNQQHATKSANVNPPAPIPQTSPSDVARSATTTSVVVSNPASTASPSTSPQPVIERTNTVIQSGLTEALLDARLLALTNDLNSRMNQVAAARTYQAERTAQNVADATRIEQLTGLTAHDLTVDGVSGLTDADLPDSLTASNYLPLSGGTLTGDLAIGGTLSASTLSVAGISSGGAIEAPYFTATSSSATSTFAGSILALGPAQFANSSNFFGEAKFGATGTTTIATNGAIFTPSVLANSATAYSASFGATATTTVATDGTISTPSIIANSATLYSASFGATGTSTFSSAGALTMGGALTFATDNQFDIGASGANRARNIYSAVSLITPVVRTDYINNSGNTQTYFQFPASGETAIFGPGGTSPRFQLGGNSSSFPSIKRNGAGLDFVLADDSAYANINAASLLATASSTIGNGTQAGGLTVSGTATSTNLVLTALTSGRVPYVTTGDLITDSSSFTFDGTALTAPYFVATNINGLILPNNGNIQGAGAAAINVGDANDILALGAPDIRVRGILSNDAAAYLQINGGTSGYTYFNGNVGINTTNPTYKLDVSGLGRFTGLVDAANFVATSTSVASLFNGGFLSLASTTIGNGTQAGGLTINGGATTTGATYFGGNLSILGASSTFPIDIGYTTVTAENKVLGFTYTPDPQYTNYITSAGGGAAGQNKLSFYVKNGSIAAYVAPLVLSDTGVTLSKPLTAPYASSTALTVSGTAYFPGSGIWNSSGNVGINTTNPTYKLDVSGLGHFTGLVDAANFVATSTSATSTFAGGITGPNNFTVQSSSGRVGIGTAAPEGNLHIFDGSAGTVAPSVNADLAVFEAASANGISILVPDASASKIQFGSPSDNVGAVVQYQQSTKTMKIGAGSPSFGGITQLLYDQGQVGLTVYSSGNVGIASTTPWAKLSITNTGTGPSFLVEDSTSPDTTPFIIDASGNVGIGTTTPASLLDVWGDARFGTSTDPTLPTLFVDASTDRVGIGTNSPDSALDVAGAITLSVNDLANGPSITNNSDGLLLVAGATSGVRINNQTNGAELLRVTNAGNVGIGTTSPWRKLSVTGTVGFDGLSGSTGAGSLCLDANKQVVYNDASDSCLSSTRETKHDISPLVVDALSQVLALQPVSFVYNEGNGRTRFGFIAEDTAAVDPHLTTYNADGALTGIDDRAILSVMVRAIKDLASKLTDLAATVANFAQSFTTKELTFDRAYGHELTVDKLCVGAVCVTEDQFMAVFGASALSQTASASASAANDNHETAAISTPDAIEHAPAEPAVVEDQPAEPAPLPEVQAANDNPPQEQEPLDEGVLDEAA